jgi:hypothetical protein
LSEEDRVALGIEDGRVAFAPGLVGRWLDDGDTGAGQGADEGFDVVDLEVDLGPAVPGSGAVEFVEVRLPRWSTAPRTAVSRSTNSHPAATVSFPWWTR